MQRASQHGFALVIALSLMAFVLLLLLSISTLVQVERQSANIALDQLKARQNALLGAYLAIGNLQKAAGPDQRVTARAEILDTDPSTEAVEGVAQPMWTGIWESPNRETDAELDAGANLRDEVPAPTWMVSTPDSFTKNDIQSDLANLTALYTSATERATLLEYTDSTGNAASVEVPKITFDDGSSAYAYWVADEGVKARIDLPHNDASNDPSNPAHYLAPSTNAPEFGVADTYQQSLIDLQTDTPAFLERTMTLATLGNLLGDDFSNEADGLKSSKTSLTTYSYGLLSDVREGGLKQDLTAALESPEQFATLLALDPPDSTDFLGGKLWKVKEGDIPVTAGVTFNGLRWHSFYFYYNLYKKQMPAIGMDAPLVPIAAATAPYGVGGNDVTDPSIETRAYRFDNGSNSILIDPIFPDFCGYALSLALSRQGTVLKAHISPALALHNPYNITLSPTPDPSIIDPLQQFTIKSNYLAQSNGHDWIVAVNRDTTLLPNGTLGGTSLWGTSETEMEFEPGAVAIFGLDLGSESNGYQEITDIANINVMGIPDLPNEDVKLTRGSPTDSLAANIPLLEPALSDDVIQYTGRLQKSGYFSMSGLNVNQWPAASKNGFTIGVVFLTKQGDGFKNAFAPFAEADTIDRAWLWDATGGIPIAGIGLPEAPTTVKQAIARYRGSRPEGDSASSADPVLTLPFWGATGSLMNQSASGLSLLAFSEFYKKVEANLDPTNQFMSDGNGFTYWGESDVGRSAPPENTKVLVRDVPTLPLISLGQFMHMNPHYLEYKPAEVSTGGQQAQEPAHQSFSLHPVGGSTPNPAIADLSTTSLLSEPLLGTKLSESSRLHVDDVWLTNDALFDRYFLSTVPPETLAANTNYPDEWDSFDQDYVNAGGSLLNPRMRYFQSANNSPSVDALRASDTAAAHLLSAGNFNINSTSVDAWRAILASLRFLDQSPDSIPFARILGSIDALPTSDDYSTGLRLLDSDQIQELAEAIVQQIKSRGPFLSLADFINRRLSDDSDSTQFSLAGPLQAAIHALNTSLNAAIETTRGNPVSLVDGPIEAVNDLLAASPSGAMPQNSAFGSNGHLNQRDLVQALAPLLTARSDTFVIRSHGEYSSSINTSDSQSAVCEVVVQRIPNYVNASVDVAETYPATDAVNQAYGRKFRIASISWLSPSEL